MTANCCYIPDDDQGKAEPKNCPKPAEWNVFNESTVHPTGGTQACTEHVGLLLQDGANMVWPVA